MWATAIGFLPIATAVRQRKVASGQVWMVLTGVSLVLFHVNASVGACCWRAWAGVGDRRLRTNSWSIRDHAGFRTRECAYSLRNRLLLDRWIGVGGYSCWQAQTDIWVPAERSCRRSRRVFAKSPPQRAVAGHRRDRL
jgi:hypothetical protein